MHILLLPFGSFGDVNPYVGLGMALKERGHRVTVGTVGYFRDVVEKEGLEFFEIGTAEEYQQVIGHPHIWHPIWSFGHIFRTGISKVLQKQYDFIAEYYQPGETVVVTSSMGFGALCAREKLGVPLVTVHLQPSVMWSEFASPVLAGMPTNMPRWWKRFQFACGEWLAIDRACCPQLNRFRAELGLPPVNHLPRWWHSPDQVLCLFPEWFGPTQPDWPQPLAHAGFPLWDSDSEQQPLREFVQFIDEHPRPLVFTPGSANQHAEKFFRTAIETCRLMDSPGILLTRYPEQLPPELPPFVKHFKYLPLERVLPHASALIHHGGIGTTAQALKAGIPQVIMPLAHDQFDNAARLKKLGVGDSLSPTFFSAPRLTRVVQRLLTSEQSRAACKALAEKVREGDCFEKACEVIASAGSRQVVHQ
ncbi:glycosyltransferase [Calycomorphotria hydatis]|uniref:MurG-like transferase n=1 Tax=Calycomorphotria hydatis TaxID=2528027 RepID=A0A517T3P6_9PLAN|nr:nucleotide disphospho-sugar-binding domain-containing protein [Calycomorphotria hydatis]QDT63003.1 MurG-like transferase [Calycomorphotria hydatis]